MFLIEQLSASTKLASCFSMSFFILILGDRPKGDLAIGDFNLGDFNLGDFDMQPKWSIESLILIFLAVHFAVNFQCFIFGYRFFSQKPPSNVLRAIHNPNHWGSSSNLRTKLIYTSVPFGQIFFISTILVYRCFHLYSNLIILFNN